MEADRKLARAPGALPAAALCRTLHIHIRQHGTFISHGTAHPYDHSSSFHTPDRLPLHAALPLITRERVNIAKGRQLGELHRDVGDDDDNRDVVDRGVIREEPNGAPGTWERGGRINISGGGGISKGLSSIKSEDTHDLVVSCLVHPRPTAHT